MAERFGASLVCVDYDNSCFKVQVPHYTIYDFNNLIMESEDSD